ncbi:Type 4 prepilin-like proteins leader peptide-processing enzyme [Acaryochloris thomasi RCC1774]|uniref:Prepilin leader peptidase/N-methyltransferase n=1 Tax=Acaryochloris thomasi RCC1774 TaxID=1764569 RepID=A0A2W1K4D8_9CYAN|nr:A24 family peptidase [Acaryochloris thomasi]PZD74697.1 Type 4 prepilin-like proteins leader peptide-processing enzyme [Acaryochloris thomasi RCC1774]
MGFDWSVLVISFLVFVLGASVGSFLNVVVYRLPAGLSLLRPPSRCPSCLTKLKPYDNVPVLGWLWLRGKCRYCSLPIAPRYPMVEFLAGCLFLLVFVVFGVSLKTPGYWVFMSWLLALAFIDLDTMTLPNPLTQSGVILGLLFQVLLGWSAEGGAGLAQGLISGFGAAVLGIWVFDLVQIVGSVVLGQTAMGGGDAKLAAMIGAWLGWKLMLLSAFLACLFGAVIGVGGIALGLIGRRQHIPFGPYLVLGAGLALFVGPQILDVYWQWLGF